jgi:Protein kinase domain/Tetratricopeptide repeat
MQPVYSIRPGQRLTDFVTVDITVQRVAHGGMGLVAMGPNAGNRGRWNVLKTIHPEALANDPTLQERFLREALTWVGLWRHPNILSAEFVTQIDGRPFLVLDYAEHGSLADYLARGNFNLPTALYFAQHIAAGLLALHTPDPTLRRTQPITHRDLKPTNVLIQEKIGLHLAQITDFGLVALLPSVTPGSPSDDDRTVDATRSARFQTQVGSVLGTPAYMAPEQWGDLALIGPPADLYALGIILAEMITGRHPLLDPESRPTMGAWRAAHERGVPRSLPAAVPEPLEGLYQSLLAKRAEERPTADEALVGLQAVARWLGDPAYAPPEIYTHTPEHEAAFWDNWANSYAHFQRYPEALERSAVAVQLTPHDPTILLNNAGILRQYGRFAEAQTQFEMTLARLPKDDHHSRGIVHCNLGILHSMQRQYDAAETDYAAALALMPESADNWRNRARNELEWSLIERQAGHEEKARQHLERAGVHANQAMDLNPNDAMTIRLLAIIAQASH